MVVGVPQNSKNTCRKAPQYNPWRDNLLRVPTSCISLSVAPIDAFASCRNLGHYGHQFTYERFPLVANWLAKQACRTPWKSTKQANRLGTALLDCWKLQPFDCLLRYRMPALEITETASTCQVLYLRVLKHWLKVAPQPSQPSACQLPWTDWNKNQKHLRGLECWQFSRP